MFQLLVILVALSFSSKTDGYPGINWARGGKDVAASDIELQDFVSNASNAENEDALALEQEAKPGNAIERSEEAADPASSLTPRMLGGSDDSGNKKDRMPNRGRNKKEKAKSRSSKTTKGSGSKDTGTSSSSGTRTDEPTDRPGPSSPPKTITQSMFDNLRNARSSQNDADMAVKIAIWSLDDHEADPYTNQLLAQQIDSAIDGYNRAYDRPQFHAQGVDERYRMKQKLAVIRQMSKEVEKKENDVLDLFSQLEIAQGRKKN